MTLDRDLDRRLVVWLDERAVAAAPADLLARSLARVDATRQRAVWRFPVVALGGPATIGRRTVPAWALLLIVGLLVAALLVVGGQIVRRYLAVVPQPTTLPTLPSTQTPQTPAPTEPRLPGLPAQAGQFSTTQQIVAASDRVVWLATETAIYRTEDGGATWRAVQPEGWIRPYSEAFVDADTAYVPIGDGSTIAVTHDGGASWATSALPAHGAGSPIFAFASASTGSVTYADPNHYNKKDGTGLFVFGTTDGGATWTGPAHGLQPHIPNEMNKLYAATGSYLINNGPTWFDLSEDGGVSYKRYTFPTGPQAPKSASKDVTQAIRGTDGHLLITMDIYVDQPGVGFPAFVWRNGDGPASWTKIAKLPAVAGPLQFLSEDTWVLTGGAPSRILSTTDAGATWRTVIPPFSLYHVQAGFGTPSWTSVDTGWIVDECQDLTYRDDGSPTGYDCGDRSRDLVLLVTTDGGATWREVGK
jgi:photosystem II stability/assembly factor-like uncharacterized protein